LTADFFVRLYKLADSYKPGNGHKKWLITIARNMAVDKIRKLDREILTENFTDLNEAGNTFSDEIVEAMTLGEAMKKLNYGEKEIVDLKIAGELTFREIAELTGRPVGTVAWVYNNAIGKLRRCKVWK
jgi:RNA polymerase sigma-70 factor (ECF subfamily)